MYVVDGIAHAEEPTPILRVSGVRPLSDFCLWVRFNNGEARVFDLSPLLSLPVYAPLADPDTFRSVYLDYGVPAWNDGEIDIAPELLYDQGQPVGREVHV